MNKNVMLNAENCPLYARARAHAHTRAPDPPLSGFLYNNLTILIFQWFICYVFVMIFKKHNIFNFFLYFFNFFLDFYFFLCYILF